MCRVQRDPSVHIKATAEICAPGLSHSRPFPSVSVFSSTLWPHLSWKQLGVEGRKERGMAGSPERGGCLREEGEAGAGGAESRFFLRHSTGRHGTCGKAEDHGGRHSPQGSLRFSPSLHSRARQAAGMGKREYSTVRVSSCPGHPCQVLIET